MYVSINNKEFRLASNPQGSNPQTIKVGPLGARLGCLLPTHTAACQHANPYPSAPPL